MDYEIGNPEMAWLLLSVPVVLILIILGGWRKRTALAQFGTQPTAGSSVRGVVSTILLVCAMVLLAAACMDVRWGKTTRTVPQKGLEVVFALDVSRSMLAEDAWPNRLARAKQQINDMVGEMAGDRIGLVVFAGEAQQAVPLTNHYNDFRQKLASVGPETVSKGGSQLGIAIEAAADAFLSKTNDHKTVVLFTDGEDQQSKPVELAKKFFDESGMRIFTVGLGDMDKGSRIPQDRRQSGKFVEHEGQDVWSKLNGSILREIATETQAAYIPAGTKRVNMADVYHNYIANVEKSEFETAKISALIPRFQWFAFPALVCLLLHGWLSTGRSRKYASPKAENTNRSRPSATPKSPAGSRTRSKVAASVVAALMVFLPSAVNAQSTESSANRTVAEQINAANDLVRSASNGEAIDAFNAIQAASQNERDALNYNSAIAHYGNSDVEAARALFLESAKSDNDRIAVDSRYNLGNCHFAKSLNLMQQPEAAIEQLHSAVAQYRSAIRLDRKHAHARENLERAIKLIKQLKDAQQNDPQDQDEDQKNDQDQDADQNKEQDKGQNKEQDNEQTDRSQQQEEQSSTEKSQSSENKQDESQNQDGSKQDSSSDSKDPNESKPQSDSKGEADSDQDAKNQSSDGSQRQEEQNTGDDSQNGSQQQSSPEQSEQGSQQQNAGDANRSQESDQEESRPSEKEGEAPPEGEITAANQSQEQTDDNIEQALLDPNLTGEGDRMMSRQEALKLLQSVRDRDMLRRFRQQRQQRNRRTQVEKDW